LPAAKHPGGLIEAALPVFTILYPLPSILCFPEQQLYNAISISVDQLIS